MRDIDKDKTKSVYNDLQIDIDAQDERMIYVDDDQEIQKNITRKLRFIQSQSLKIVTRIYKAIATKTFEMKLHVFLINLHMSKKMIIKIMIRMNFKTSRNAIAKTINRIQKDLKDKKERRTKLKKTFATMKRI